MRAGVGAVQHTLTPAAASVIRAALAEAKRRGHSQVQPLHVAAILLIQPIPGSPLRRACLESHNSDLSHPLQCRALELCFKVALDRLPSNQDNSPSPVLSNALVAALKRAQAHQRRGTPEQSLQPLLAVKVEMDQLIISIMDDPSVSRVMREAGFCSTDVKTSMEEAAAQHSPSLTGSSSSLDSSSQLRRREGLAVTPFTGPPLESVQIRSSLFSSVNPLLFPSHDSNLRMVERGILSNGADAQSEKESSILRSFSRPEADGLSFSSLENFPHVMRRIEQSRRYPQAPASSSGGSARSTSPDEDVRNVVETLLKKRNPVLVSDGGMQSNSFVVSEFSQRLKSGEVPASLKGVLFLNFPFKSLTVGHLSQEEMEQKLTQLRNDVEGSMPKGAILSLGDLQWLAEYAEGNVTVTHAQAGRAIQELTLFLDTYSTQRFWLLATASSKFFMGSQASKMSLETRLNLQPILVSANSAPGLQPRYIGFQNRFSGSLSSGGQMSSGNPIHMSLHGVENGRDDLDCCPECLSKYQNDLARLMWQDRGSVPGLALSSSPNLSWMRQTKDMNRPPLAVVKEEEDILTPNSLLSKRIQDLKDSWRRVCSAHSGNPGGLSAIQESPRSFPSSSEALPENILPEDKSSALMSKMMNTSRGPESAKFLVAKSGELSPPKVRRMALWASSPSSVSCLSSRAIPSVSGNAEVRSNGLSGCIKKDNISGAFDLKKPSSGSLQAVEAHRDMMGADLALGQSSAEVPSLARDLREEGQHPLLAELKLSVARNCPREAVPQFSLTWSVPTQAGTDVLKRSDQKPPPGNFFRPNDVDSVKGFFKGLKTMVPWQVEASDSVASTVFDCRSGNGRKRGSTTKSDTWFLFLGPDKVGKREVAKALAKLVFRDEKKIIWMQLSGSQVDTGSFGSGMDLLTSDKKGGRYRGKTPLDRLVEAVRMKPFSVVLLEDVDQADSVVRGNLLRAMERGKLSSSNGEVSFANVIVIMTCSVGGSILSSKQTLHRQGALAFEEEKLSRLSAYSMKFQVEDSKCEKVLHENGRGVSVVNYGMAVQDCCEQSFSCSLASKRRAHWTFEGNISGYSFLEKRPKKEEASPSSKALALDLNLSAEENEPVDDDVSCATNVNTPDRPGEQETEEARARKVIACARESLPKEMFDLVDAPIVFSPFDFATLAEGVLQQIESASRSVLKTGASMEIDVSVLEQLVSAAWQTNSDQSVFRSWVNDVLVKNLSSLPDRCEIGPNSVVKLMIDRGQALETQESNSVGLLPASIKFV